MNHAYLVLLAIGTAALHDTGRRLEMPVVAASPLDAAVTAENAGNTVVADEEYVHSVSVRPVRSNRFTPGPELAVAI